MEPMPGSFSRALGGVEENWSRATAGGTGIAVLGALFNRLFDGQHISAAVQHLLDAQPMLRTHIVENAKSKLCIQVPDSVSAESYVLERAWPEVCAGDYAGIVIFPKDNPDKQGSLVLDKVVNDELNINFLNSDGKPSSPWRVFQVNVYSNNARQQTVIALKFHSGALDRQSSCVISHDFFSALSRSVGGTLSLEKREVASNEVLPAIEDLIPKGKASKNIFQKGVDAVGYAVNAKKYSLLPFHPSFTAATKKTPFESHIVSLNLGKHGTASLLESCKKHGVIPAAALSAALLKTVASMKEMKEKKQDHEFSYTCVLDCRDKLEPKLAETVLGNYSLGMPQNEKVKEGMEFWEFAAHINESIEKDMKKSKYFSETSVLGMLFSQVMKHPSLTPLSSMRISLFTLFVDPPLEMQWKNVEALNMVGTLGPFSSMHFVGPCFCLGDALLEGPEFVLSLIYTAPVYSRDQILNILHLSTDLLSESCKS